MSRAVLIFVCSFALLTAPSLAAQAPQVQADPRIFDPINSFVNAFNGAWQGGPAEFPGELFTDDIAVIDLFPPFYWHGRADVAAWFKEITPRNGDRSARQHVELGVPTMVTIGDGTKRSTTGTGDTAYVVVPATLTYDFNGQPQVTKAMWSWTLRRDGERWRIAAHSWATVSETQPHPVQYLIRVPWPTPSPGPTH